MSILCVLTCRLPVVCACFVCVLRCFMPAFALFWHCLARHSGKSVFLDSADYQHVASCFRHQENHGFLGAIKKLLYLCSGFCRLVCLCAVNERVMYLLKKAKRHNPWVLFWRKENHGFFCIFLHFPLNIRVLHIRSGLLAYFFRFFQAFFLLFSWLFLPLFWLFCLCRAVCSAVRLYFRLHRKTKQLSSVRGRDCGRGRRKDGVIMVILGL